jgi:hypothetical protein
MRRETSILLTLSLFSTIVPPIFAQDLQGRPDPVPPPNVIGPQLIVWSEMQRPQPIPEPVREPGQATKDSKQPGEKGGSTSSDRKSPNEAPPPATDPAQKNN